MDGQDWPIEIAEIGHSGKREIVWGELVYHVIARPANQNAPNG